MSIVKTGLLRYLYDDARIDIEYKSSEFWQHYLGKEFGDTQLYSVTCEVPPDGSRRRVGMVVKRYDVHHDTMTAILWVEFKQPGGSIQEVEAQALDAAQRYIQTEDSLFIYTMTIVGVSFRVWFYKKEGSTLIPLHGDPTNADGSQYIDADSEHAWVLPSCIEMVKSELPLRDPPTVPSQSLSEPQVDYGAEEGHGDQVLDTQRENYAGEPSSSA
jgi:hypothetical protein